MCTVFVFSTHVQSVISFQNDMTEVQKETDLLAWNLGTRATETANMRGERIWPNRMLRSRVMHTHEHTALPNNKQIINEIRLSYCDAHVLLVLLAR